MPSVEVQVTAAEGCGGDLEDCIGGLLDLWVWAVFYGDLALTVSTWFSWIGGQWCCLALKSLLSTTARIVSGGVKPMFVVALSRWLDMVGEFSRQVSLQDVLF
jgi:hypothetical protein